MAIKKPSEMDFTQDNIIMLISGLPGVGKTSVACSAPEPIVIDADNGLKRVNSAHRKDAIFAKTYEELKADLTSPEMAKYKTIVIDTCGALIELMKDWAEKQPNGAKKGGGISQAGYGIVKSEFSSLFRKLRSTHNCVLIFHTNKDKDKDGNIIYDLQCEGATKQTVWQPVDLGAYMQVINNERYLCFSPTQEYSAKSSCGVKGIIKVPEFTPETQHDFLTRLFESVKENIAKEAEAAKGNKAEYDAVMDEGRAHINSVIDADSAAIATQALKTLPEVLTSRIELQAAFKAKLSELGLKWNKEARRYE